MARNSGQISAASKRTPNRAAAPRGAEPIKPGARILGSIRSLIGGVLLFWLDAMRTSRTVLVISIVILLALFGGIVDFATSYGKAYAGVTVGGIDVGGLGAKEIEQIVSQEYTNRLSSAGVTIYANQDALTDKISEDDYSYDSEDISVEEDRERRVSWSTDSASLQAYINYAQLSEEALTIGRGNPLERFKLFVSQVDIPISINYNEAILEALAHEIDLSIGQPLVNYDVEVSEGVVNVIPGEDGDMVNRDTFKAQLSEQFLKADTDNRLFVVDTEYTPVQINESQAQATAKNIESAIHSGINFICGNNSWTADAAELGSWIQTTLTRDSNGSYALVPSFSLQRARTSVLSHIPPTYENGEGHVRFAMANGNLIVGATSKGTFPLVGEALESLNVSLFSQANQTSTLIDFSQNVPTVTLGTAEIPDVMTLEEALSFGIVTPVSEFETEYTTGAFERNTNIHLAADLINNSIIPADGGLWSFNQTTGECNAEKGFLEAHAIAGNSLIDEIGGGICQVATTVFNAVYEGGYPIVERHNHTIYFSSYPQGRDAAVSWPSPDLKWRNDSPSDLLLVMSYTDSTVKATLYGEDMGYSVESEEGEIQEGSAFTTVYETDDTLYPGAEYVRIYGYDGHSVTVTRTVKDAAGNEIIRDDFTSIYAPQNTIVVRGPQS